ncbi:hypothetical protein RHSIM_Rhsim02G0242700 [Rhododendron simsii]|uniref:DUF7356 domain-containing protein n=1 Tax=Rhododendron simsii TaxID=118357 RepID=A0A834HC15_RHOSS|nr:hypothetical protein RHSIM_Rhsim02G0242700 [Rhododendron simsii]
MGRNHMLVLTLCWSLIVVALAARPATDLEVKGTPDTGLDPKSQPTLNNTSNLNEKTGGLKSVIDSGKVDQVKNDRDQVGGSKEDIEDNKVGERNPIEQKDVDSKGDEKKGEDGSVGKGENKVGDQVEKKDEDGSVEKGGNKEGLSEGGKGDNKDGSNSKEAMKEEPLVLPLVRKEGSRGEECDADASNSCKVEKDALIACLRVPGNDSPDLSLLIQNKGNDPLSVTISAPNFVQLEKTNVQLQQKEDKKVKVSITEGGTDSTIVLTARSGNCSLDFKDLTNPNPMKETEESRKSAYINLVKKPHLIAFVVIFTLLLITASAWMCVNFKRRHFDSNASKYQKLDMELPVSGGGKVVSEINDGWDNNWDDNWDDEEAPKTPSMPVTPSVSSKGLASRRLNKEGWKD